MKIGTAVLMSLTPVLAVNAHPGHPTLDAGHVHGPLGLDPVAAVPWAAAIVLVGFVGLRALRRPARSSRARSSRVRGR